MTTHHTPHVRRLRPPGLVQSPAFSHVALITPGCTTVLVGGQNGVDANGVIVGTDIATQTRLSTPRRSHRDDRCGLAVPGALVEMDAVAVLPPEESP